MPITITIAEYAGTCSGVNTAISIAEKFRVPILGPLVHNPSIIQRLSEKGIPVLERGASASELKQKCINEVILTAHGYPKEKKLELIKAGVVVHDATCKILSTLVYSRIQELEKNDYAVILLGNPDHAEIKASRSYGENIIVVNSVEDATSLPNNLGATAIICQTTMTAEKFNLLCDAIVCLYPDTKIISTRCRPVQQQQSAVVALAKKVELMIIVGGMNSSNTTNLASIAKKHLPSHTHHIDTKDKLNPKWLTGVSHIGIGAGTSTPLYQIEIIIERIKELSQTDVNIVFESSK